ncbi:MAG TPA: TauD/TfdA family dioxygenase [Steroidobacteraceae bacterium]|nr:TauD/TfdA family dioxygenase [Steroidobacteraceae bacterium]
MALIVNRLGPQLEYGPFAAEIRGADLHRPPDETLIRAVNTAMAEYAVVVLRDQHIDDAEQVRFARAFGPLELPPHMGMGPAAMKVRVGFGLYDISNLDADGHLLPADSLRLIFNKGNENFHTDSSFNTLPTKWSMLSARIVPPQGGDTEFCDARAAWDALPGPLRERARRATAEHWLWKTRVDAGKMQISDEMRHAMPPARHPVVRTVPESGRTSLYLGAHVTHIVGWPKDESDRFIADINGRIARAEFRYLHRWQVGDLLIWDNRCTLHRATPYPLFEHKRDMRRATINEYGPEVSSTTALGIPPPKVDIGEYA